MYRYFESLGPQVEGTVLSSTSAGSGAPTEILSLTLTGATCSFPTYPLVTVCCSGSITMVSAGPTPTVCASACVLTNTANTLAAINVRFILCLRDWGRIAQEPTFPAPHSSGGHRRD